LCPTHNYCFRISNFDIFENNIKIIMNYTWNKYFLAIRFIFLIFFCIALTILKQHITFRLNFSKSLIFWIFPYFIILLSKVPRSISYFIVKMYKKYLVSIEYTNYEYFKAISKLNSSIEIINNSEPIDSNPAVIHLYNYAIHLKVIQLYFWKPLINGKNVLFKSEQNIVFVISEY